MIANINRNIFDIRPKARIIDIGSAIGHNSVDLKKLGCVVTALEIDPKLVETFRARPEAAGIDIQLGDARKMPFKDGTFDGAILIEVIEHIPETEGLLEEIYRVLRPGGMLCIGVPTAYTEHIYWRIHPNYARNATHVKILSKRDLQAMISRAGFAIRAVETRNFVPAVSWCFHALLRSHSDHTGTIYQHLWIDRVLDKLFSLLDRMPVARRGLQSLSYRIGKSWYFYCEKAT